MKKSTIDIIKNEVKTSKVLYSDADVERVLYALDAMERYSDKLEENKVLSDLLDEYKKFIENRNISYFDQLVIDYISDSDVDEKAIIDFVNDQLQKFSVQISNTDCINKTHAYRLDYLKFKNAFDELLDYKRNGIKDYKSNDASAKQAVADFDDFISELNETLLNVNTGNSNYGYESSDSSKPIVYEQDIDSIPEPRDIGGWETNRDYNCYLDEYYDRYGTVPAYKKEVIKEYDSDKFDYAVSVIQEYFEDLVDDFSFIRPIYNYIKRKVESNIPAETKAAFEEFISEYDKKVDSIGRVSKSMFGQPLIKGDKFINVEIKKIDDTHIYPFVSIRDMDSMQKLGNYSLLDNDEKKYYEECLIDTSTDKNPDVQELISDIIEFAIEEKKEDIDYGKATSGNLRIIINDHNAVIPFDMLNDVVADVIKTNIDNYDFNRLSDIANAYNERKAAKKQAILDNQKTDNKIDEALDNALQKVSENDKKENDVPDLSDVVKYIMAKVHESDKKLEENVAQEQQQISEVAQYIMNKIHENDNKNVKATSANSDDNAELPLTKKEANDKKSNDNKPKWDSRLTEEQILDALSRDIYEPVGDEYEQFLMEHGLKPIKNNSDDNKPKWDPRLTEEQILDAISRDIYEPVGDEYEQFLLEHGLKPIKDIDQQSKKVVSPINNKDNKADNKKDVNNNTQDNNKVDNNKKDGQSDSKPVNKGDNNGNDPKKDNKSDGAKDNNKDDKKDTNKDNKSSDNDVKKSTQQTSPKTEKSDNSQPGLYKVVASRRIKSKVAAVVAAIGGAAAIFNGGVLLAFAGGAVLASDLIANLIPIWRSIQKFKLKRLAKRKKVKFLFTSDDKIEVRNLDGSEISDEMAKSIQTEIDLKFNSYNKKNGYPLVTVNNLKNAFIASKYKTNYYTPSKSDDKFLAAADKKNAKKKDEQDSVPSIEDIKKYKDLKNSKGKHAAKDNKTDANTIPSREEINKYFAYKNKKKSTKSDNGINAPESLIRRANDVNNKDKDQLKADKEMLELIKALNDLNGLTDEIEYDNEGYFINVAHPEMLKLPKGYILDRGVSIRREKDDENGPHIEVFKKQRNVEAIQAKIDTIREIISTYGDLLMTDEFIQEEYKKLLDKYSKEDIMEAVKQYSQEKAKKIKEQQLSKKQNQELGRTL